MDQGRGEIELYNEWFAEADVDRDNRLSGGEAVSFFGKSGLNKQTLFKIWQGVAGDRSYLNRQEFYTAMKLVSVAQGHGGVLEDGVMARIINGLGEKVGVPRMTGLNDGIGNDASAVPVVQTRSSVTSVTSVTSVSRTHDGVFPPMTAEKARVYQTAFDQLDSGNRQILTGTVCFGAFMQSGLSKGTLKDIWDVVAGNSGELNRHQFVQCMYLIDWVKGSGQGKPVPKQLPPQFPPVADAGGIGGVLGRAVAGGPGDIFSGGAALAVPMPGRAVFTSAADAADAPAVAAAQAMHTANALYPSLSAQEQENLAEQERLANAQAEQLRRAEQQRKEIAERQQFYTSALADLRLSQSKSSRGLVEAEQRLEMERKACAEMEAQYEAAYEEFNDQHARIGPVLKTLEEVEAEKSALVSKKTALESAVKNLEEYSPEWEARERGECEALRVEIAELIVSHAALEKSTEAMKRRRETMLAAIDGLKAKIAAERDEVVALKAAVDELDDEKRKEGEILVGLLQQVVPMYTRLYSAARDALVPLPNEVVLGGKSSGGKSSKATVYEYDAGRYGAYDTSDWHVFQDEAEFSVVSAIPADDRMETFMSPSVRAIEEEEEEEGVADVPEEVINMVEEAEAVAPKAEDAGAEVVVASEPASEPVLEPVSEPVQTKIDNPTFVVDPATSTEERSDAKVPTEHL